MDTRHRERASGIIHNIVLLVTVRRIIIAQRKLKQARIKGEKNLCVAACASGRGVESREQRYTGERNRDRDTADTTPAADEKRTQDSNGVHRSLSVCEGSAASLGRPGITTPANPHHSLLRSPTNRALRESSRRGEV